MLRNDFSDTGFGAVGYLHDPLTAGDEVGSAGFDVRSVLGIEGPGWLLAAPDRDELLDPAPMVGSKRSPCARIAGPAIGDAGEEERCRDAAE